MDVSVNYGFSVVFKFKHCYCHSNLTLGLTLTDNDYLQLCLQNFYCRYIISQIIKSRFLSAHAILLSYANILAVTINYREQKMTWMGCWKWMRTSLLMTSFTPEMVIKLFQVNILYNTLNDFSYTFLLIPRMIMRYHWL